MCRFLLGSALIFVLFVGEIWGQSAIVEGSLGAVRVRLLGQDERTAPRLTTLSLGSDAVLSLDFDLIGSDQPLLTYRITHYGAGWKQSELQPIEYLTGFEEGELPYPRPSHGTLVPYVHYSLDVPVSRFRLSGYYRLSIYAVDRPDAVLLSIPFAVTESVVSVDAEIRLDSQQGLAHSKTQQVNVGISLLNVSAQMSREVSVDVLQGGRLSDMQSLTEPSEITQGALRYADYRGALFLAGNEYRRVEHTALRGEGMGVVHTRLNQGVYAIDLAPDTPRSNLTYRAEHDLGGRQVLRMVTSDEVDTEGEYHMATFRLMVPRRTDGQVIIIGQAFDHIPYDQRTMYYDESISAYTLTLPLKSGYQEWQYAVRSSDDNSISTTPIEGDYYQTTNEYQIFVWRRTPSDRFDRLIGYTFLPADR